MRTVVSLQKSVGLIEQMMLMMSGNADELSFQRTRSLTRLCSRDRVHAIMFNKTSLSTRNVSFTIHVTSMRVGAGGGTTADSYSTDVCIRSEAMFVPTTTSEPPNIAYLTRSY